MARVVLRRDTMDPTHVRALLCLVALLSNAGCGGSAPARSAEARSQPSAAGGSALGGRSAGTAGSGFGSPGQSAPSQPAAALECITTNTDSGASVGCEFPILWSRTVHALEASGLQIVHLAVDAAANLYVAASLEGEVDWGGERVGAANRGNLFVVSYAPSGERRWVRVIPESSAAGIAADGDNQVCAAGHADGSTNLAEVLNPEDPGISFVKCWSLDGTPRWARRIDGLLSEIDFDRAGNLLAVIAGYNSADGAETSLSSFNAAGAPRWTQVVTRSGRRGSVAGHPDGSIIFAGSIRDELKFGAMRVANTRTDFDSTALAALDSEGNGLWGVVQEEWFWGPVYILPAGDILLRLVGATQRYDARGNRIGRGPEQHVDAAIPGGFISTVSTRMGSLVGWTITRLGDDLSPKTVTTHALPDTNTSSSRGSTAVSAPTGEVYVAATQDELLGIARIATP